VKSPDEFEALGVEPVFPKKDQAINDAENRASFRSGKIRILDYLAAAKPTCRATLTVGILQLTG